MFMAVDASELPVLLASLPHTKNTAVAHGSSLITIRFQLEELTAGPEIKRANNAENEIRTTCPWPQLRAAHSNGWGVNKTGFF